MLKNFVAAALIVGLPYLAVNQALPADVLMMGAVLLALTWLLVASHKDAKSLNQALVLPELPEPAKADDPAVAHDLQPQDCIDLHFGRLFNSEGTAELCASLPQACELASKAPAEFFGHLTRLLRDLPGKNVVFIGETSGPDFDKLLAGIPADQIKRIDVGARTDQNPNVNATLECSIWLNGGVIRVRPQWCAWSANRADELVSTLLVPLVQHGVMSKVCVIDQVGLRHRLPNNFHGIVQSVFTLAGYPDAANSAEYGNRLPQYISLLVRTGSE